MNNKLTTVLSTSFLVMGLAAGCGIADDGDDRDRNNLTPVGYDNRTNFTPLNVATDDTANDTTNDGVDITTSDPALNQNENTDGDGTSTGADNETDGNNTADDGTNNGTTGTGNQTNTGDQTLTQTPTLGGNVTAFTDVPKNSGYFNDIHDARKLGLLNGTDTVKNTFGYNQPVTREQIASILMKAYRAGYISGKITTNDTTDNDNTDTTGTDNGGTNTTGTDTNGTNNNGTNTPS